MKHLTPNQTAVLDAIIEHRRQHGVAPTVRELAEATGSRSTQPVHQTLCRLRDKGYITWAPRTNRGIAVLRMPDGSEPSPEPDAVGALRADLAAARADLALLARSVAARGDRVIAHRERVPEPHRYDAARAADVEAYREALPVARRILEAS